MFQRTLKIPKSISFFLFGARGTGKSTLMRSAFSSDTSLWFNLLDLEVEERLARHPMELQREVLLLPPSVQHVVIDEIQKLPRLLDVVHNLIETHKVPQQFILTGSSARKLKAGGANLLAGRAALRTLHPLTAAELGNTFNEAEALQWGTLPKIWNVDTPEEREDILRAYANIYLKEEIWGEQLIRQLDPFRRFLEVAARQSGKIVNHSKIARDVGVDVKTVQSWYQVVEDTLIGFHLDAYHSSVRKQLRQAPKFYFFDVGVTRALAQMLRVAPAEQTSYFGDLFEQFVVCELNARNQYEQLDYRLSYLQTKSGVEVDVIVERPGKPTALVEIKSTKIVTEDDICSLQHFLSDFPESDFFLLSRDPKPQKFGRIKAVHWRDGIGEI
ncbi:ATP-binding protein [bacterium]|nr:ATP-binding protein [bacterium]